MDGMGLKFTPVIGRSPLGHLSMFGSMVGTSWTHIVASPNSPKGGFNLPLAAHPPPPPTPPHPLPPSHPL